MILLLLELMRDEVVVGLEGLPNELHLAWSVSVRYLEVSEVKGIL